MWWTCSYSNCKLSSRILYILFKMMGCLGLGATYHTCRSGSRCPWWCWVGNQARRWLGKDTGLRCILFATITFIIFKCYLMKTVAGGLWLEMKCILCNFALGSLKTKMFLSWTYGIHYMFSMVKKACDVCVTVTDHRTVWCSSRLTGWPVAVQTHCRWAFVAWGREQADTGHSWNLCHIHRPCNRWSKSHRAYGRRAKRQPCSTRHDTRVSGICSYLFGTPIRSNTVWNCKQK